MWLTLRGGAKDPSARLYRTLGTRKGPLACSVHSQLTASHPLPPPANPPPQPAVAVSAGQVKALRDSTGAGMMDCKKALAECGGDNNAAAEVRATRARACV